MKQTPLHHGFNPDLLALIPKNASRVIEVGCSSGALAKAFLELHPSCEYIGIEIDPDYAKVAESSCSRVVVGNIEHMNDSVFSEFFPSDCWVFGDVIEHMYDPWSVLKRLRGSLPADATVVACIPNAQHWSVQARLNCGAFRYENAGLMDFTHIRWFTKTTIIELFKSCGFQIVEAGGRILEEPERDRALLGITAMAEAMGANVEDAAFNATPFQWVVRATLA